MNKAELKNVTFRYMPGTVYETLALNDVSVGFEDGKITGLIGHTGSGKSTLVGMLNGLIRPMSGEVLLDGENIWEKPKNIGSVRFRVGLVMQYPEYQLFEDTVEKDISFGPKNMGLSPDEISRRVKEAADIVGLSGKELAKSPFDLSGGQKRRAAIAGVMAMEPELLVLDEPAAGLDPVGRETVFSAIADYRNMRNSTVVIVSHSMEDMARWCDVLTVMADGGVLMTGSCEDVFSHAEELKKTGLDLPQITKLMLLLREKGVPVGENIYTVETAYAALTEIFGKRASLKRI